MILAVREHVTIFDKFHADLQGLMPVSEKLDKFGQTEKNMKNSPIPLLLLGMALLANCNKEHPSVNGSDSVSDDDTNSYRTTGSVERLDPAINDIIATGTLPEIVADSFDWSEGPVWAPELKKVLFSDIPRNSIFSWNAADGLKLYLKPSGYTGMVARGGETGSNGLLIDASGRLVMCQHGDRRMARMDAPLDDPAPEFVSLADGWNGKKFNSPNDAVFSSKGALYFTDPAYGMEKGWNDPLREINFAGVYRLNTEGTVELLIDSIPAPNGIGLSPDEKTLYVGCSSENIMYAYDLAADGSLSSGRVFIDARPFSEGRAGAVDGMAVRSDGTIFSAVPGGIGVFDPEGKHLGTVLTGQRTSNCALNEDGTRLYITADMFLMRIRLK